MASTNCTPDHSSRFIQDADGTQHWRQTLDWRGAHIVDHGGSLWIWQPHGGYRLSHPMDDLFYDLSEVYGED
jgi:hypothetical protein